MDGYHQAPAFLQLSAFLSVAVVKLLVMSQVRKITPNKYWFNIYTYITLLKLILLRNINFDIQSQTPQAMTRKYTHLIPSFFSLFSRQLFPFSVTNISTFQYVIFFRNVSAPLMIIFIKYCIDFCWIMCSFVAYKEHFMGYRL